MLPNKLDQEEKLNKVFEKLKDHYVYLCIRFSRQAGNWDDILLTSVDDYKAIQFLPQSILEFTFDFNIAYRGFPNEKFLELDMDLEICLMNKKHKRFSMINKEDLKEFAEEYKNEEILAIEDKYCKHSKFDISILVPDENGNLTYGAY